MRNGNKSRRRARTARPLKIKRHAIANLEAELLRRVRVNESLSRVELARRMHLAPSTAGAYVDRLIKEGFLVERQKAPRDHGRPPTLLSLNPEGGRFIGVDFEAHNIMATIVDFSQKKLREVRNTIRPTDSVEQIIGKIEGSIEELMNRHRHGVLGIGIGVPGIIDPETQTALHYPYIKGWENIPLGQRLRDRFKVPVHLENNIRSMALAETWFGQARDLNNFVCLGIRTGIAAGIVVRRHVLHGKNNLAGEIGDWLCPTAPMQRVNRPEGNAWACGELRPLEEIASAPALLRDVRDELEKSPRTPLHDSKDELTIEKIAAAAEQNDQIVAAVLDRISQTLGWALCHMNSLFNPEKIILAGSLVPLGEHLLSRLRKAASCFCSIPPEQAPMLVNSTLGDFNGALGAAALALHEWTPKR
jgi:N-acetylglucosamine repressor